MGFIHRWYLAQVGLYYISGNMTGDEYIQHLSQQHPHLTHEEILEHVHQQLHHHDQHHHHHHPDHDHVGGFLEHIGHLHETDDEDEEVGNIIENGDFHFWIFQKKKFIHD